MFGLKQIHIESLNQCFAQYPDIEQVIIYGSRAIGNHRNGSDIDLTIVGSLDFKSLLELENQIDDLLLPYKIDISLQHHISNMDLIAHIEHVGKIFYDKNHDLVLHEPPLEYKPKRVN
jgi:uncharacterized protein